MVSIPPQLTNKAHIIPCSMSSEHSNEPRDTSRCQDSAPDHQCSPGQNKNIAATQRAPALVTNARLESKRSHAHISLTRLISLCAGNLFDMRMLRNVVTVTALLFQLCLIAWAPVRVEAGVLAVCNLTLPNQVTVSDGGFGGSLSGGSVAAIRSGGAGTQRFVVVWSAVSDPSTG
jgi:hypothetical protein